MRTYWAWLRTKFWWLLAANGFVAFLVFCGFGLGWKHGSITAPNLPAWFLILAVVPALMGASLRLRTTRHSELAVLPLLFIPVPTLLWVAGSLLLGILYLLVSLIAHLFGHGRVN